ncbi:MAG: hypothetical protein ACAI34_10640 [Verrucomicrobium sp.]|nr:hypothetical protein [Verrucomicrobium sp.]
MSIAAITHPFLSERPVSLPKVRATPLEYRTVVFRRGGEVRLMGDCRLEGRHDEDETAIRVFFRPPPSDTNTDGSRSLPDQPVAPNNADLFLTAEGLEAVTIPRSESDPCVLELPS